MTIPNADVFALLDAAKHTPLSQLIRNHGKTVIQEAAELGLIRLDGAGVGMRWALHRADSETQQTITVHLTEAGHDYLGSA